ncbi:hypothetical protein FKM82_015367 [Ascaphus truei]
MQQTTPAVPPPMHHTCSATRNAAILCSAPAMHQYSACQPHRMHPIHSLQPPQAILCSCRPQCINTLQCHARHAQYLQCTPQCTNTHAAPPRIAPILCSAHPQCTQYSAVPPQCTILCQCHPQCTNTLQCHTNPPNAAILSAVPHPAPPKQVVNNSLQKSRSV